MANRRRTRRRAPPSRLRYEQEHPTVSFRVPRSLYLHLKEILGINEQSFADFVKEALGAKILNVEAAYIKGYTSAKEAYLVTYRCAVCRKTIEVESSEAKAAASDIFEEIDALAHEDCRRR